MIKKENSRTQRCQQPYTQPHTQPDLLTHTRMDTREISSQFVQRTPKNFLSPDIYGLVPRFCATYILLGARLLILDRRRHDHRQRLAGFARGFGRGRSHVAASIFNSNCFYLCRSLPGGSEDTKRMQTQWNSMVSGVKREETEELIREESSIQSTVAEYMDSRRRWRLSWPASDECVIGSNVGQGTSFILSRTGPVEDGRPKHR